jgi:hypothetical protein
MPKANGMKHFWLLLVLASFLSTLNAQNFGGNPPMKWAQMNTDTVRVIFPKGLDSIANRIATIAHYLQRDTSGKYQFRKINLVLQNNSTVSNAYVTLAPYKSEFFLTAPQNAFELGSLSWADNLIVHEWRHVQQYNYFNRGLAKVAGVFLGQEGRALFNALAVPDWFFEGDAVWNETKFSRQGRGRLPLAFSGYKSLFLEGRHYNYMKLRNGSLKDYVPNHYDIGYLLVAYGAERYGKDFWNKVTADASAFKPLFYPLQGAIKRYTGISFKQFVDEAFNFYEKQWKQEVNASDVTWLTPAKDHRTDYLFPYVTSGGNIIAVKQGSKENPALYEISGDGKENKIASQGITVDRYFSYKNGRVVYAAYSIDPRWNNREYSNIAVLDAAQGRTRKITAAARYFSPDISADGKIIVAVEMKTSTASRLVVLNDNGQELRSIDAGTGEVFSQPKFSADDKEIYVAVRNAKGWMSLRKYSFDKPGSQVLVPFKNYILGFPVVNGDTVLFTATANKRDDVYAWTGKDQKLYHVATYPAGMYQTALRDGKLVSSVFTSTGYRLAVIEPKWNYVEAPSSIEDLYIDKALDADLTIENIPPQRFSYKKYPTLSHPFNFHSWRPFYDPPEYSFTIYGDNVLNTIATEASYIYNQNENSHAAAGTLVYGGTFIQPYFTARNTWNRSFAYRPDTLAQWNEFEYAAGLQLPLNLTGGKMYRFMNVSASYHSTNINFTGRFKDFFRANDVRYLSGRFSYSSQIQKASQQIYPGFALSASLQFKSALNVTANQVLAIGNIYLPGLLKTHSIVLSAAYQGRDTMRAYSFSNNFPFSRGYDVNLDYPRMWKVGVNYHFTLGYPEVGLANIVYFLRLRANTFTDYSEIKSLRTNTVFNFKSVGGELYFDTKWWNQLPVSFGIRYSRLLDGDIVGLAPNSWELIIPVDLIR